MLRSQHLELQILRYVRAGASSGWRATTLPELANTVNSQEWGEVPDALKRLHQKGVIHMRKWIDPEGFALYGGEGPSDDFFHHGFQMQITFNGRTCLEALEEEQRFQRLGLGSWESFTRQLARNQQLLRQVSFPTDELVRAARMGLVTERAFGESAALRETLQAAFATLGVTEASSRVVEGMREVARQLQPLMESYGQIGRQLAEQVELQNKMLRDSFIGSQWQDAISQIAEQSRAIERISISLPEIVPTAWPADILGSRLGLIEDALKNVSVWQKLREETLSGLAGLPQLPIASQTLDVAGQFVLNYGLFVRRLPPPLPLDEAGLGEEEESRHRDEEVGARLEIELAHLDQRLVDLRRRAWESLRKGDPGATRLAAAGAREVYTEVLHRLAPDAELLKSDIWQKRDDNSLKRPTRRMRIEFIVGPEVSELDMLLQFDESIAQANKFTHKFADNLEIVRVSMAQLENCTYLLLSYRKSKGN